MVGFAVYDMEQNRPTRQTPGFVDLVAFGHGLILFIECKSDRGRLSAWQRVMRDLVIEQRIAEVFHFVWRSPKEAHEWWETMRSSRAVARPA